MDILNVFGKKMRKVSVINSFPEIARFDNLGWINGKRYIILTKPLVRITSKGKDIIPVNFISDGASIPQIAQSIIGHNFGEYLEDVIAHDWDYSLESVRSRLEGDNLLRETMWNRNISLWKVSAFYLAVRNGGKKEYEGKGNPK